MTENEVPLRCPRCQSMNIPGAKPSIEINNGTVTCISCGHSWVPKKADDA